MRHEQICFAKTGIVPRLQRHEQALSLWRYEGAYAFYNAAEPFLPEDPEAPASPDSYVWTTAEDELLGHVSYGPDGQIPTVEAFPYSEAYLDMGLGLRPDLCGHGLGSRFLALCAGFARGRYGAGGLRLTVASFNTRAIKVYARAGFAVTGEVTHRILGNTFFIMTGTFAGGQAGGNRP